MKAPRLHNGLRAVLPILLVIFIILPAESNTVEDRVAEISAELMCPVCEGQSVAESNSQLARDMRSLVRKKLEEGNTKEEIIASFVSSYGDEILAAPPARGFSAVLWFLPILSVLIGAAIILWTIRSFTKRSEK